MILIRWREMRRDPDVSKAIPVSLGADPGKSSVRRYGVIWGDSSGDGLLLPVLRVGRPFLPRLSTAGSQLPLEFDISVPGRKEPPT